MEGGPKQKACRVTGRILNQVLVVLLQKPVLGLCELQVKGKTLSRNDNQKRSGWPYFYKIYLKKKLSVDKQGNYSII